MEILKKKANITNMTNFIPIFPLAIVVFPGEQLNLHIFEPRYKQLITEHALNGKPFGIPTVLNNKMEELGTLVEVSEVVKKYDNGELDIRTKGLNVFRILETINEVPDKLYSGAIVNYPENESKGNAELMKKVVEAIRQLHKMLNVSKPFPKNDEELTAYDVAHHAGLSLDEEYELLGLMKELQRQEYLRRHLQKVIPVVAQMETLKEKVKLNGHFRNLSGFEFDFDKEK
jgi:Lon protease-like protein